MKKRGSSVRNVLFRKKKTRFPVVIPRKKRRDVELSLLADFLANRISAAGVSHVVKAPSRFRRMFWVVVILLTSIAMALMTYRVLQEYLAYPTVMRSMEVAVTELEFPAVTICGLSTVPKIYAKEAGLYYMEEMRKILDDLPRYKIAPRDKTRCLKDPLCFWSWFDDVCYCFRNPCETLYCFPDIDKSDDKCMCSMLMCQWNGTADSCFIKTEPNGNNWCICTTNFTYPLWIDHKQLACNEESKEHCDMFKDVRLPRQFVDAVEGINASDQIKELLKHLKGSKTRDLRDVERFFVPPIYVMDDFGFPADLIILSCSFSMLNCWEMTTLYTPLYGKCYMLNYIGKELLRNESVWKIHQAGRTYGLQLFMRSRSNDSLPLLARQLGVRLVIHDPRSIPVTSEDGIDIRPGDMTSINLKYTEINRLGPPWGKCAKDGEKLGSYSRDPYLQNDCERECINMEVFRRCKCYHPKFIRATTIPRRGKICKTNDSTAPEDRCFAETMFDNDRGYIRCNCPPPCRQKSYEITMSTSKLNEEFFKIVKQVKSLKLKNDTAAVTEEDFESSLMGVQIYYSSLFAATVNETAIYSWESLIANIGGNMGLFLGLSIVTLLEILEFFGELISKAIMRYKGRTSKVNNAEISPYTF